MQDRWKQWALAAVLGWSVAGCAASGGDGGRSYDGPTLRSADVAWHELWPELAGGPTIAGRTFDAEEPDPALRRRLRAAAELWVERDLAGFAAARDELGAEPLGAFWMTRWLILRMLEEQRAARRLEEQRAGPGGEAGARPLPVEPGGVEEEAWRRTFAAIVEFGGPAAPCIVLDLLRSTETTARTLGAELLPLIGEPALPALLRVLDVDDERVRRTVVQALAAMEPTERTRAALFEATRDPQFGVRAQAWRGFTHGEEDAVRLRTALRAEPDPFVRLAIVETLGEHRDPESAAAVLGAFERALVAEDERMIETSRETLQRLAGRRDLTSLMDFRSWVESLTTSPGDGSLDAAR